MRGILASEPKSSATSRDAGWTIVSPDLVYGAPLPEPESIYTMQGRVFALADDAGRSRNTLWTWAIDEQVIDLQLSRSGAFAPGSD